ncbi:hypothetical protein OSTOST_16494, partial [Ostertagia ostertagi]
MSSRPPSRELEGNKCQKRKRGGQVDVPRLLKSPCNKAARPVSYTVFLCGFSDRERRELRKHCTEGVEIEGGAWLLRPSWILSSKDGIEPESEHEISFEDDGSYTAKFKEILLLYKSFRSSPEGRSRTIFSAEVFRRVFVLTGRTTEGKQKKAALRSLISAGGGSVAADDCWRIVREKPCKAAGLISAIIIGNGEDLSSHDINVGFVKQLLTQCVPILYEEMLSQILFNQVVPNLEIMMTHAMYYWCNEHPQKLKLSSEDIECIRNIQHESGDDDSQ